jgi:hypothetical protein
VFVLTHMHGFVKHRSTKCNCDILRPTQHLCLCACVAVAVCAGPKGDMGEKGDNGDIGEKGPAGPKGPAGKDAFCKCKRGGELPHTTSMRPIDAACQPRVRASCLLASRQSQLPVRMLYWLH